MTEQAARIGILGGGFGGLYTALRLSQLPWDAGQQPEILLVNRSDRFLFTPLLYELVSGELQSWEVAPPFVELLRGTGVQFYPATVTEVDVSTRKVRLQSGGDLTCDRLVLAFGGETPLDRVPGAMDYALPFRTLEDAYRLEERLRSLAASDRDRIRIAIIGAGYSGVELACKLADRLGDRGRLRLVEQSDQILKIASEFNRTVALRALETRGIWLDLETTVEAIAPDSLSLLYKGSVDTLPVELVLWSVGVRAPETVHPLPLKKNPRGQIVVSPTLQAIDFPAIFALGDLADCQDATGQQMAATAQVALQQADYVAWNLWASLTGRPLLPFRYQHLGEIMALGKDNATLTAPGITLDGSLAYLARRLAYLYRMPTLDHQLRVGFNWITQPLLDVLSSVVQTDTCSR